MLKVNRKVLVVSVTVFIILSSTYLIYRHSHKASGKVQVSIQIDRDTYTPLLSSTVGIGLIPLCSTEKSLEAVRFHWHTSYGHFVSWGPPDYTVITLGTDVVNSGEKIYWSYNPDEMDKSKPIVRISLTVEDALSGRSLVESFLEIGWEEQHVAKVIVK